MNSFAKLAVAAFALVAGAAQATTLTFDNLNTIYGDSFPLGPNMTGDGRTLSYSEGGYVLTLYTSNDPQEFFGAHIGDAGESSTFNWHDEGDNEVGAYVTLTKAGGGAFNLVSFDFSSQYGLTVTTGAAELYIGTGPGTFGGLNGVTSVTFSSSGYSNNVLDNLLVTAGVPEPATWGLMIVGFGAVGVATRRRRKLVVNA